MLEKLLMILQNTKKPTTSVRESIIVSLVTIHQKLWTFSVRNSFNILQEASLWKSTDNDIKRNNLIVSSTLFKAAVLRRKTRLLESSAENMLIWLKILSMILTITDHQRLKLTMTTSLRKLLSPSMPPFSTISLMETSAVAQWLNGYSLLWDTLMIKLEEPTWDSSLEAL